MPTKTDIEQNWISEETACELLNIKSQALRNRCRSGIYSHRIEQDGKKFLRV